MSANGRSELLARYGRFYGDEHFALAFTAGTSGEQAKRVTTTGWDKTRPSPDGDNAAAIVTNRGAERNVAVVVRPSNLVVIECDSEDDLIAVEELDLPRTLTVRSSEPYKRHFYFRPPDELEALPYVAFRFESTKLTADSGRYFLAPPSLHPSGVMYDFLPGLGPGDVDIAELPEQTYRDLSERARREDSEQRERIAVDPEAKIMAGNRRDMIFRYACMLRRWGLSHEATLGACQEFNATRCHPPVTIEQVRIQVDGAMKLAGDQEIQAALNGGHIEAEQLIVFEPLRAFLERDLPPNISLVGTPRDGTNLLPQYGWVMPWGPAGAGKTSVLVDLLFHACSGLNWIGYTINRALKIVVVINEGVPGGLQDKLRQKQEHWDRDIVLDNLAVYASPWGEFSFKDERAARHARDYALEFGADYVAFDPLHTLGTIGAGTPEETEKFKHQLRGFGLWQDLGVITAHHSNKGGMVSGDWARHPDTVIHMEKDGKAPVTKITIQKARPADPAELGVPFLLDWETETLGYTRREIETTAASDETLIELIHQAVTDAPEINMGDLKKAVKGDDNRITALAKAELGAGRLQNVETWAGRYRLVHVEGSTQSTHDNSDGARIGMDSGVEACEEQLQATFISDSAPVSGVESVCSPLPPGGGLHTHALTGREPDDIELDWT